MASKSSRFRTELVSEGATVTQLELFFDLVFVFALTQVTAFMAHHLTWQGVVQGIFIIALLWWSWASYSWVGAVVRADEGAARLVLMAAMAPMFLLALAIPETFKDLPGGLHGPTVVAVCYLVFRALHILIFWIMSRGDRVLRGQVLRFIPSMLGGTVCLLIAAQLDGWWSTAMWAAALLADYGGNWLGGARGWRMRSATHFAERHGLIVIIALGESIVAIGVGIAELPISWPIVLGAIGGLGISVALWWLYFDMAARHVEHAFVNWPEATRAALARAAYTYLHLPLVGGIVLLALGLKKVLEYVGDTEHHSLADPITGIGLYALYGGVVITMLGNVAFKWCALRTVTIERVVVSALLLVLIPVAAMVPALAALGILLACLLGLVLFETLRYAETRFELRHLEHSGAGSGHGNGSGHGGAADEAPGTSGAGAHS